MLMYYFMQYGMFHQKLLPSDTGMMIVVPIYV